VRPGQMVLVPMEDDATTNLDETYASTDFQAPVDDYHKRVIYRVKSGDTLSSIARRYGTSVSRIKDWNGMRSNTVRAGQRLTIWQAAPQAKAKSAAAKSKGKAAQKPPRSAPQKVTDTSVKKPARKTTGG
jgi:LysM repeat protein